MKLRIELRNESVLIEGYINAVARDSKPMIDEKMEQFVEQIVPKTFQRALEKTNNVPCLLDHIESRMLGSTKQGNIDLFEDNIGLRAICEITDSEVIDKARKELLRGWSFGFELLKSHEELVTDGIKRRFVEDINLLEVSIIDDRATPAYIGTSIETRAEKPHRIEYRSIDFKPKRFDVRTSNPEVFDFSKYKNIIKILEEKTP